MTKNNPVTVAIETSGKTGSIAVLREIELVAEERFTEGLHHGREIAPRIREALSGAGMTVHDIDLVAVSAGPGSYTGLRVGVATAKTLAWALGREIVTVPTLDIVADGAPEDERVVAVATDSRKRGMVYAALYERAGGELRRRDEMKITSPDEFARDLPEDVCLVGDAVELYLNTWETAGVKKMEPGVEPRAGALAELAYRKWTGGGALRSPHDAVPIYLRMSEAEERLRGAREKTG